MSFLSRPSLSYAPPPVPGSTSTSSNSIFPPPSPLLQHAAKPLPSLPESGPPERTTSRRLKITRKPVPRLSHDGPVEREQPNNENRHQPKDGSSVGHSEVGGPRSDAGTEPEGGAGGKGRAGLEKLEKDKDKTNIMRRMSSIFRSSKRKAPPSSLALNGSLGRNNVATMFIAEESSIRRRSSDSEEEYNESEDDIRRPSGLGSAVSLEIPPSPSFLQFIASNGPAKAYAKGSPRQGNDGQISSPDDLYPRARAVSSPNILRSFSIKAKKSIRKASGTRQAKATSPDKELSAVSGAFSPLPPLPKSPATTKPPVQFPIEVLDLVLSYLPRGSIASLSCLSRSFCASGRVHLYNRLDLTELSPLKLRKLLAMLASRPHLTDLVHDCTCRTWPHFFKPTSGHDFSELSHPAAGADEDDEETQLKNQLLTATFTLALQRMSNLTTLVLPAFDSSLLAQHTAFGLRSLTFLCTRMNAEETWALFTWLDGQVNVVELRFPNLQDSPSNAATSDNANGGANTGPGSLLKPPEASPWSSPALGTTPLSPGFPASVFSSPGSGYGALPGGTRKSLYVSPTLLPALTTLHATPAILALLQPPALGTSLTVADPRISVFSATSHASNSSSSTATLSGTQRASRPLHTVRLNINTTLYTGLRPNAIMGGMKGSVRRLGIRFGESVDRRSVEKCLGAVGAILGSKGELGEDGGKGLEGEEGGDGEWRGLEEFEVSFAKEGAIMPSMEETLYKTLQSTLPRYTRLRKLHLNFTSGRAQAQATLTTIAASQQTTLPPPLDAADQMLHGPNRNLSPTPQLLTTNNSNASPRRPTTASSGKSATSYKSSLSLALELKGEGDESSLLKSEVFKFPKPPRNKGGATQPQKAPKQAPSAYAFAIPGQAVYPSMKVIRGAKDVAGDTLEGKVDEQVVEAVEKREKKTELGEEEKRAEAWRKLCPSLQSLGIGGPMVRFSPAEESSVVVKEGGEETGTTEPSAVGPSESELSNTLAPPLPPKPNTPSTESPTESLAGSSTQASQVSTSHRDSHLPAPSPATVQRATAIPFPKKRATVSSLPSDSMADGAVIYSTRPPTAPAYPLRSASLPTPPDSGTTRVDRVREASAIQNGPAATERKRLESLRALARICARDQRWTPKDAEEEEFYSSDEDGDGLGGSRKQEVRMVEAIKEVLDEGPPEPRAASGAGGSVVGSTLSVKEPEFGAGVNGHRAFPSFSSMGATEGSADYGDAYVSYGYGEGFPNVESTYSYSVRSYTDEGPDLDAASNGMVLEPEGDDPDADDWTASSVSGFQRADVVVSRYIDSDSEEGYRYDDDETEEGGAGSLDLAEVQAWLPVRKVSA
ncbi:hypothetical protein DFP72DRAFT_1178524 [Ephemerocybe angulata]|uniref:F-box domain-containing protein n=1 Tax=Ephemerocybe angulata TaxID=980116 RepID=A0A8H6LUI6_9AGAR|nr:hypothetical protein DFP72DRAFT_1178524 [Tulosesus angulatus]